MDVKWFAVNCTYQVICGEGKHSPQINEQTRLIQAKDIAHALKKARTQAEAYNAPFENCEGDRVIWKFVGIGGINEIEAIVDGVEVWSKILEPKSVDVYLESIKHRDKILTEKNKTL